MHDTQTQTTTRQTTGAERERQDSCPECSGHLVKDTEQSETVCSECGLVVDETEIDRGPEWRGFDAEERDQRSRVGAPTTNMMHDKGLSTNISWQNRDANGNTLSSRKRERIQRLRTWNERFRTRDAKDRNLKQALGEIDRMASALGLPENVRETASVIYRRALQEGLLPGRSIEGVATAALYAAARNAGAPRSFAEFEPVSRIERDELTRTYRYILRELELKIQPATPGDYVPRFVSELGLSGDLERCARELLSEASEENQLSGKSPVGLAAAAIYAASLCVGEPVTQKAVAETAGVTTVTIRNRYRELSDEESPFAR